MKPGIPNLHPKKRKSSMKLTSLRIRKYGLLLGFAFFMAFNSIGQPTFVKARYNAPSQQLIEVEFSEILTWTSAGTWTVKIGGTPIASAGPGGVGVSAGGSVRVGVSVTVGVEVGNNVLVGVCVMEGVGVELDVNETLNVVSLDISACDGA